MPRRVIAYEIRPANRKSIKMDVAGNKVVAHVPKGASEAAVEGYVRRLVTAKAKKILRTGDEEEARFAPGQTLPLLGVDYPIEVAQPGGIPSSSTPPGGFYDLRLGGRAAPRGDAWYKDRALEHLSERAAALFPLFRREGRAPSRVVVGDYSSQWGSCSRDGVIRFHWRLVTLSPRAGGLRGGV